MRRNHKPHPVQNAAIARMEYRNRQVDKFIKWSKNGRRRNSGREEKSRNESN